MKILILANSSSGVYDFRGDLILKLIELGNEISISSPLDDKIDELKSIGCRIVDTSIDRRGINPIVDLKLYYFYKKILKSEKPDLVITYTIKPNVYGGYACRKAKIPYSINITGLGTAFENGGILKKIVIIMNKVSCKKAKVVFFENEENRQVFIKNKIVRANQTYRLNGAGVNLEKFQVTEYPHGVTTKFLFMGRLMAEKGINELFEAMKKLVSDGEKVQLDVLGKYEEDYKEIIEKYENEGWLHYHGYQKDVKPFIQACHCFVLPSWHEGMANTNLESAASGRPVITSNIFGCKEAVIDDLSGYLVERINAIDLYEKMKVFCCLSYEKRRQMGLEGRKHMEKVFDKKKVVEETIKNLF